MPLVVHVHPAGMLGKLNAPPCGAAVIVIPGLLVVVVLLSELTAVIEVCPILSAFASPPLTLIEHVVGAPVLHVVFGCGDMGLPFWSFHVTVNCCCEPEATEGSFGEMTPVVVTGDPPLCVTGSVPLITGPPVTCQIAHGK